VEVVAVVLERQAGLLYMVVLEALRRRVLLRVVAGGVVLMAVQTEVMALLVELLLLVGRRKNGFK
jgi:hypothetical protein